MRLVAISIMVGGLSLLVGCPQQTESKPGPEPVAVHTGAKAKTAAQPSASASTAPPVASHKPYTGPTATLTGVVRIEGDPSPKLEFRYPEGCASAAKIYGKLFREGPKRELADALIAVTGYDGFVPAKRKIIKLTVKDCVFSARTIVLTDGQHIELKNKDAIRSYVPYLEGSQAAADSVAVPSGPAIKLRTRGQRRYWLRDKMGRSFMVGHVFHLPYSTAAVSAKDGRYRIEGIPVGKVRVSVMLPQTRHMNAQTFEKELKPGTNQLDLSLTFKQSDETASGKPAASSAASSKTGPSSSSRP